ncbi:MAG: glycine oxidase ThiO [Planctomycetes bacterium]|nr:glycine oxidase ThiO [Planctomycetota bacterium]
MKVAIVGGGIIGLSLAWRLINKGFQVTVYDANAESREASWAAAGMLAPHNEASDMNPLWELCCASYSRWPQFLSELGVDDQSVDYRSHGSLIPLLKGDCAQGIEKKFKWLENAGIPVERWTQDRVLSEEPELTHSVQEAVFVPGGQVNPRIVCRILRERCAERGVSLLYRQVVQKISQGRLHMAHGQVCDFDHVVVAAGAWTPQLAQMTGIELLGEPVKGQLIAFKTDLQLKRFIHCAHAYCVPRAGTGLVVGASVEHVGFDRQDSQSAIAQLMAGAQRLLPQLRTAQVSETWTGLRPRLNGGMPMFARMSDQLSICSGHFRNGILLTPISAEIMSQLICNEKPAVDLAPFNGLEALVAS